jgi:hypothetical protein
VQSQVCTVQAAMTLRCALGDIIPAAALLRRKIMDCSRRACLPRRGSRLALGKAAPDSLAARPNPAHAARRRQLKN